MVIKKKTVKKKKKNIKNTTAEPFNETAKRRGCLPSACRKNRVERASHSRNCHRSRPIPEHYRHPLLRARVLSTLRRESDKNKTVFTDFNHTGWCPAVHDKETRLHLAFA